MNNSNKKFIRITAAIFSFAIFLYLFDIDIFKARIQSGYTLGLYIGYFAQFFILGYIFSKFLEGIIVSDKSLIMRNVLIIFFINILIYTFFFTTSTNVSFHQFLYKEPLNYLIGYFVFSIIVSFVNVSVINSYRNKLPFVENEKKHLIKYFIYCLILSLTVYYLFVRFGNLLFIKNIFYDHLSNYLTVGFITIIFLLIFFILDHKKSRLESKIVKEATKAETATANFETLKNQLDPHFLFNSLNVLTGLIEENPEKAVDFTTSLSKIYRYLLEQKDKDVVPLEEEIKFAKTYINLLKLRFENSIDFELEIKDYPENEFIVPLSLQILLENTIKHNSVTESKPLKIRIYKENQHLIVENSYQPKDSIKDSTGVGLNNIKNRYQLISNQKVSISNDNEIFKVELPILNK